MNKYIVYASGLLNETIVDWRTSRPFVISIDVYLVSNEPNYGRLCLQTKVQGPFLQTQILEYMKYNILE